MKKPNTMKFKVTSLSFPDSLPLKPQENLSLLPYLQKISIHYLIPPKKSKSADLPLLPLLQKKQTELNSELLDYLTPQKYPENADFKFKHSSLSKKKIKSFRDSKSKKSYFPIEKISKKTYISEKNTSETEKFDFPFEFIKNKDLDHEEQKIKGACSKDFEFNSQERCDSQKIEQQKIAYDFAFEDEKEGFREAKRNFFSYQKKLRRKGQSVDLKETKVIMENIVPPNEEKEEENTLLPLLPKYKERRKKEEVQYSFEKLMVYMNK